jgi:hypothetical protein
MKKFSSRNIGDRIRVMGAHTQAFLKAALLISLISWLAPLAINAQTNDRSDGMRFLPDVPGQFTALTDFADPLGLHIASSPNPSSCKHYQGVVRVQGADGTPFLIMSRSGNLPNVPGPGGLGCDDSPGETDNGHLIVFRMESRNKYGERLRSNRLRKGVHVDDTPPNVADRASIFFTVAEGGLVFQHGETLPPKIYQHPGGMQVVGNVLALAVEHPRQTGPKQDCALCKLTSSPEACERCRNYEAASSPTKVMFFDVSNPEDPEWLSEFALVDGAERPREVAGTVAITPLADGHYLMMVTGGDHNQSLWFYRSTSTNLASKDLSWLYVDGWHANIGRAISNFTTCEEGSVEGPSGFCLSPDEEYLEQNWPDGNDGHTHQTLQFLREGNIDGTLYLAGVRGKYGADTSTTDLYRVDCDTPACNIGDIKLKRTVTRDLFPHPNSFGKKLASFGAASGFYVSPSSELLLYVTEHDNDGPDATVMAGEWRHKNVVREGSPTLLPTAVVNGPYVVDEGGEVDLNGSAQPPITKAWLQLFHGTNLRSFNPIVDYDDYYLDDFDDFNTLEYLVLDNGPPFTLNDKARSWNWFAPQGCSIVARNREEGAPDETKTLFGLGSDLDLSQVWSDGNVLNLDKEIDAVAFSPTCQNYYATLPVLQWDLDVDGTYETSLSTVKLNARAFDGPSVVNIPAQAVNLSSGEKGQATAMVTVRNVAPGLTPLRFTDSAGQEVNAEVPFVLTGLPLNLSAGFSDPGVLDHQTGMLNWGDGTVVTQSAFAMFDEAFGDGIGAVAHTHTYTLPGSYSIALSVADDDDGTDAESAMVRVLTPEQAVEEIISLLDGIIAITTNNTLRHDLNQARDALAGNNYYSNNGALQKIRDENQDAAIAALQHSIERLRRAEAGGAEVSLLIALSEQVVAALSAA